MTSGSKDKSPMCHSPLGSGRESAFYKDSEIFKSHHAYPSASLTHTTKQGELKRPNRF